MHCNIVWFARWFMHLIGGGTDAQGKIGTYINIYPRLDGYVLDGYIQADMGAMQRIYMQCTAYMVGCEGKSK